MVFAEYHRVIDSALWFFDEVERNKVGMLGKAGGGSLDLDLRLSLVQGGREDPTRNGRNGSFVGCLEQEL